MRTKDQADLAKRKSKMLNYLAKNGEQFSRVWSFEKISERFELCKKKNARSKNLSKFNNRFEEIPKLHQIAEYKEGILRRLRRSNANERAWESRKK